ncbi:MAG: glycerol-3-phosphate 1-O-acyltransferase PlsY [bacterium]|nr:glycerol-3-phosphate 1-O-acyltransferase PlsY [bacterium]
MPKIVMLFIFSYLLGAIPFGYLAGKLLKGIDIREYGSGNLGATNVYRTVGKITGIIVLLLDIGKGLLAVIVADSFALNGLIINRELILIIAGLCAVMGHNWPLYLKFKGGKGVATSVGIFIGLAPVAMMICIGLFVIIVAIWRYISLGSIVIALSLPLLMYYLNYGIHLTTFSAMVGIFIILRHISNIKRLYLGTENKFGQKNQS